MAEPEHPVTNPSQTHTDLPLPRCGNSGNSVGGAHVVPGNNVWQLLDDVQEPLPQPPIEVLDPRAVLRWVERAGAALLFRRDLQRLLREAMRILDDDWRTAMATSGFETSSTESKSGSWPR
ncbi:MAG: hypothetical protein M3P85_12935 [Actinomycetota bacterium]|nr:hypothetical protein [Actinomycetota bacterium]